MSTLAKKLELIKRYKVLLANWYNESNRNNWLTSAYTWPRFVWIVCIDRAKFCIIFVLYLKVLSFDLVTKLVPKVVIGGLKVKMGRGLNMLGGELIRACSSYRSTRSLTWLFFSFYLTMSSNFFFNLIIFIIFYNYS